MLTNRIHVRRTDHGREAPFRELWEYMEKSDAWFAARNITGKDRRIYLASGN